MMNGVPRRIQVEKMTPAELAIRSALHAVEDLPPDPRLTEAGILLISAQEYVADFVDGVTRPDGNVHTVPTHGREHVESKDCWCQPEMIEDCTKQGGTKCYLRREVQ